MRSVSLGIVIAFAAHTSIASERLASPGDWPHFNRDKWSSRYSPLDQINADNVNELELAWVYSPSTEQPDTPPADADADADADDASKVLLDALTQLNLSPSLGVTLKAVPVVVNGTMYVPTYNSVAAIDAASGKEIWRHTLAEGMTASQYGVNYWPGNDEFEPRIVFTSGRKLVALDAATGDAVGEFGSDGVIDMGVTWTGVPVVFRDVLAVGAIVREVPQQPKAPGDTRAFDAVTGAKKWVFHSVPRPGEIGHETWLDDGWRHRSGTNNWGPHMSVDEELGLLYFNLGSPSSNYYGGDRPGNNLFGNSIVAVDGDTGKYRWHFQFIHHDLWDYDNPPAPSLINIERDGETIPAIAQIGKTGWMFILDRRNGEPIFGVEERPVAVGDVPGEWYSPTQPFPLKPYPLARMSFSREDMVTAEDTTAAHAANCKALYDRNGGFYNAGPFTPFLFHKEGSAPRSTILFPGSTGGTLWGGMATDQQLGYLFVYTQNLGSIGWTAKKNLTKVSIWDVEGPTTPYTRANVDGNSDSFTFSASAGEDLPNYPCQKPPWGQLNAVNANTGEIIWQRPVGVAQGLPEGKRNTGLPHGYAGPTATAGGLLFYAALRDGQLRAFDSRNGEELWSSDLGSIGYSQPISFLGSDGRQYVSITVGGEVRAFALPRNTSGQ